MKPPVSDPAADSAAAAPAARGAVSVGSAPTPVCDTRTAILDAAESLFAEQGVDVTSVRQITQRAKVNLAAVNYHFRTKQHLALEVYARRIEPVNEQRIAMLDEIEREAGEAPPPLEKILEAMICPAIQDTASGNRHEMAFILLMGRSFQEHSAEVSAFVNRQFDYVVKRFDAAILRAVPELTREELLWRMSFSIGALHHSLDIWARYDSHPTPKMREHTFPRPDCGVFARRLIHFVAAGLRA